MKRFSEIKTKTNIRNYKLKDNLSNISDAVSGFNCGEVISIAAKPGTGKTTLATSLLCEFANMNLRTLFINCDGSCQDIKAKINKYKKFLIPNLKTTNIFVDDGNFNITKINKDIAESKADVVFIDYLQLLENGVLESMKALQKIAKQSNCVIFILSEFNTPKNRKPYLSQINEHVVHHSDQVWFIWFTPLKNIGGHNIPMVCVFKNRKGGLGFILLKYESQEQCYRDLNERSNKQIFSALKEYDELHDWKTILKETENRSCDEDNDRIRYILDNKFII